MVIHNEKCGEDIAVSFSIRVINISIRQITKTI